MSKSAPFSQSSIVRRDRARFLDLFAGVGAALRRAYHLAVRPVDVTPNPPPAPGPSTCMEQAVSRVRHAAQSLEIVSALAMNPVDPNALDAGIDVALRRLAEDIHR